jgi:hypothetical protein
MNRPRFKRLASPRFRPPGSAVRLLFDALDADALPSQLQRFGEGLLARQCGFAPLNKNPASECWPGESFTDKSRLISKPLFKHVGQFANPDDVIPGSRKSASSPNQFDLGWGFSEFDTAITE